MHTGTHMGGAISQVGFLGGTFTGVSNAPPGLPLCHSPVCSALSRQHLWVPHECTSPRESGWKSTAANFQWRAPLRRSGNTPCPEAAHFEVKPHQVFTGLVPAWSCRDTAGVPPPKSMLPPKICFKHSFLLLPDQLL